MHFKLENITNLTTARWAAAEGFSYLSFNFDKTSGSYIQPMQVVEICKWITGPYYIGCFGNQEPAVIKDIYDLLPLDFVEINLATAKEILLQIEIPCILCINSHDLSEAIELQKNHKSIKAFSLINIVDMTPDFPMELSFLPQNLNVSLNTKKPYGINFNSENESEPGLVDFEKLESALEKWRKLF